MAFFDELKDKARELAQTGAAKTKQLSELAKLKANSVAEEEEIKKAYIALGKLYYAERGMAPEAAYAALCEKITAAKVNIEENKNRMEELKAESGVNDFVEDVQQAGSSVKESVVDPLAAKVKETVESVKTSVDEAKKAAADKAEDVAETTDKTVVEIKETVANVVEDLKSDEPKE